MPCLHSYLEINHYLDHMYRQPFVPCETYKSNTANILSCLKTTGAGNAKLMEKQPVLQPHRVDQFKFYGVSGLLFE